jgi:hypothetical protein
MRAKCKKCETEQNADLSAGFDFCKECGEMITMNNIIEDTNE